MVVYMVRNKLTGLYAKRGHGWDTDVDQDKAAIWTTKNGPAQMMTKKGKNYEVVEFYLIPKNCPNCRGEKLLAKLKEWGID